MTHDDHHSHANHSHPGHHHHATGNIQTAFFLNLAFTIVEIVGAALTNSMAILADAVHDLGDTASLGLAWFLERLSHKGRDSRYTYGYRRFSMLGGLISALVLLGGSVVVLSQAIPRLFQPQPSNAKGMILLAILGVIVNGIAVLRLRLDKSLNSRMMMLHLLEDVLGWVSVLIVGIVLIFKPWHILDAALSILVTCFVLFNALRALKKALPIIMQAMPEDIDTDKLLSTLTGVAGVKSAHHPHAWSIDGQSHALTAHVVVAELASGEESMRIKSACKRELERMGFTHVAIEIEHEGEECGASE